MSRDGLVPKVLSNVDEKTGTPRVNTLVVSGFVAALAAFVPLGRLADATSIGTLFAFGLVNVAVVLLRRRRPDLPRTFRVPLAPFTPLLGLACCAYLMLSLDAATWIVFGCWMLAGLALYFTYGIRRSELALARRTPR
jgi:APA family basic amino acid/polyamine antiporter